MKVFNIILVLLLVLAGCRENKSKDQPVTAEASTEEARLFGESFDPEGYESGSDMALALSQLDASDSLSVSFRGQVTDVCKMKGCWIKVSLEGQEDMRVTFKDYGFFVPMDIVGKEVTLHGKGFVKELSVEDQQHLEKDGGATDEEIQKINSPKLTYSFIADGVLLHD